MSYARQTIVQQAKSFEALGFETHIKTLGETAVTMRYNERIYKFSDPDEGVVIQQLCHFYHNFDANRKPNQFQDLSFNQRPWL